VVADEANPKMRQGLVLHVHCRRPAPKIRSDIDDTCTRFLQHRYVRAAQFATKIGPAVQVRDGVRYLQYAGVRVFDIRDASCRRRFAYLGAPVPTKLVDPRPIFLLPQKPGAPTSTPRG